MPHLGCRRVMFVHERREHLDIGKDNLALAYALYGIESSRSQAEALHQPRSQQAHGNAA
jgi:hypothetical protein